MLAKIQYCLTTALLLGFCFTGPALAAEELPPLPNSITVLETVPNDDYAHPSGTRMGDIWEFEIEPDHKGGLVQIKVKVDNRYDNPRNFPDENFPDGSSNLDATARVFDAKTGLFLAYDDDDLSCSRPVSYDPPDSTRSRCSVVEFRVICLPDPPNDCSDGDETDNPLELPKGKYFIVVRDYDGQRSIGGAYVLTLEWDDRGKVEDLSLEEDDKDTSHLEKNLPFNKID